MDTTAEREQTSMTPMSRHGSPHLTGRRDLALDSLRGLAAFLMVSGHVIGSSATRGMRVADDSVWRLSHTLLEDVRMPLFTVLSGFVFALRPLPDLSAWPRMIKGKSRRLLLPLLVVAPAYMVLQALAPDTNTRPEVSDLMRFIVFPYEHFWFLQSIFVIFALIGVLAGFGLLDTPHRWGVAFGAGCVANLVVSLPADSDLLSTNGTARILPFFLLGYGLRRFDTAVPHRSVVRAATTVFGASYGLTVLTEIRDTDLPMLADRALSLAVAGSGITALVILRDRIRLRWLAWVGYFSFGIYLLHVFGTAPVRMLLGAVSLDMPPVVFAASVVVGVFGPIAAQVTVGRVRWVSLAVFGQSPGTPPPLRRIEPQSASPSPS